MGETFYKRMFLIGGVWNVGGGIVIVLFTNRIFSLAGLKPPVPTAYYYSWIALFVTFGIGYFMVYRDMYANKNIVILGIIGKLAFSVVFICNMLRYKGQIPAVFSLAVAGDLLFVILFAMFLNFARRPGR